MTLDELREWTFSARFVDSTNEFIDNCGNENYDCVFKKDGKLYLVSYANGHLEEKWSDKGYIRGEYPEPREVQKRTRLIEETYYE
jgi:hypothetical protein